MMRMKEDRVKRVEVGRRYGGMLVVPHIRAHIFLSLSLVFPRSRYFPAPLTVEEIERENRVGDNGGGGNRPRE